MKSVLIVDDSKVIRDLLEKIFSKMFFKATLAEDGEEALQILKKQSFDLVVLDYQLPVVDGIDVLTMMKKQKNNTTKFVFCSSINSKDVIERAINSECDDYIIKPFDEEIIATKLKILEVL